MSESQRRLRISLRIKLFLLLTILPVITLGLYLLLAVQLFEEDKLAYVFDANSAITKSLASQTAAQIRSLRSMLQPLVAGYSSANQSFDETSRKIFAQDTDLFALWIYSNPPQAGAPETFLTQPSISSTDEKSLEAQITPLISSASNRNAALLSLPDSRFIWCDRSDSSWIVALVRSAELSQSFDRPGTSANILVDGGGRRVLGAESSGTGDVLDLSAIFSAVKAQTQPDATLTLKGRAGNDLLVSTSSIDQGNFHVISIVGKKAALRAVDLLLAKSVLFFVVLISGTVLISLLATRKLTGALTRLHEATRQIAQGNFEINVEVGSRDEVEDLAVSFRAMARQIVVLLRQTEEKSRMEAELKTARLVQETLFPAPNAKLGPIDIAGGYEPASECGGDWWFYNEMGGKYFIWIGDVTGHGVPAALMTSAARATAQALYLEGSKDFEISPARVLEVMNQVIYATSKGEMNMTLFIAAFDPSSGDFSFANAGHNPPYLFVPGGKPQPLLGPGNPRLGEKAEAKFDQETRSIAPGSSIVLYTDGIFDVKNPEDEAFGKKRARKLFEDALASHDGNVSGARDAIFSEMSAFRKNSTLPDDVTIIVLRYAPGSGEGPILALSEEGARTAPVL